jgi:hypothetical protein
MQEVLHDQIKTLETCPLNGYSGKPTRRNAGAQATQINVRKTIVKYIKGKPGAECKDDINAAD